MYYPQQKKEPSGCMEALLITRIVFGILAVPFLMLVAAIAAVILAIYALTFHPLLAVLTLLVCGALLALFVRWEMGRVKRQLPPEDGSR